jgi:hypothetical protein
VILIDPALEKLLRKFVNCVDPETGGQEFIGAVKVRIVDDQVVLFIEEETWETPSGSVIDTKWIKEPSV